MSEQTTSKSAVSADPSLQGDVWARLRDEREARGLSIGDVSAVLKLTPKQIQALESGDLAALPGLAFARGFARNYARFLAIDPAPLMAAVDAGNPEARSRVVERMPTMDGLGRMPSGRGSSFSALPAALISLALLAVLVAGWYFQWFESREEKDLLTAATSAAQVAAAQVSASGVPVPDAPAGQSQPASMGDPAVPGAQPAVLVLSGTESQSGVVAQPVLAAAQGQLVAGQSAPAATATNDAQAALPRLVFTFDAESWVEVRDSAGKVIFSRLNQAGSTQEVQGAAPFAVVVGNAPKVQLSWKGQAVDLKPHTKVSIARLTVQ